MTDPLLILGTGALATLFAARLSSVGVAVTMLGTWQQGVTALSNEGARLDGAAAAKVRATDNPKDCRGMKHALVLVKAWQTERAASQLLECLAEDGLAVTLQNGLGNDELLAGILGWSRVGRGVTTLGATLLAPGQVHLGGEGPVVLEAHPRLSTLEEMLRVANFNIQNVTDARPLVWGKLVLNAAINPLTALLRVKNGGLLENSSSCVLMGELAGEAALVAKACGIELPFQDPVSEVDAVARNSADNISSMLQDIRRGAQTEVDAINGMIVRLGEEKGVPVPVNRTIWHLVSALSVRGMIN
jgi:2-dehydropantoate 2-reductase